MLSLLLLLLGILAASAGFRPPLLKLSRADGTIWTCNSLAPAQPSLVATNQARIGSDTNYWNGHWWAVDYVSNTLIEDGRTVGELHWSGGPYRLISHHGFAITRAGVAWLISPEYDGDNLPMVFKVNLQTAELSYVDYIRFDSYLFLVNGLVIIDFDYGPVLPAPYTER